MRIEDRIAKFLYEAEQDVVEQDWNDDIKNIIKEMNKELYALYSQVGASNPKGNSSGQAYSMIETSNGGKYAKFQIPVITKSQYNVDNSRENFNKTIDKWWKSVRHGDKGYYFSQPVPEDGTSWERNDVAGVVITFTVGPKTFIKRAGYNYID